MYFPGAPGNLVVKSLGTVTERLLVHCPVCSEGESKHMWVGSEGAPRSNTQGHG
jgi:hypothetical protein